MTKSPKTLIAVFFAAVLLWILVSPKTPRLIVYCAHDAIYSNKVLAQFTAETGIKVEPRFDSEATKSLGLVELIIKEAQNPRCDVFWNNELLGMLDLDQRGLLEPYQGEGHARIPDQYKSPTGTWTGFAARMRMMIGNTQLMMTIDPSSINEMLAGDLSRVAIAKPMFGTTLTHYAVLWDQLGADGLKAWHNDTRQRGLVEAPGNGPVKNLVGRGICQLGFTDTDDYFLGVAEGLPVSALPARVGENQTIVIPNTVAIIKGSKHQDEAQQLVDFLLSSQTELILARSPARQIPLGPIGDETLPSEVEQLVIWAKDSLDLRNLLIARNEVLAWLRGE